MSDLASLYLVLLVSICSESRVLHPNVSVEGSGFSCDCAFLPLVGKNQAQHA